MYPKCFKHSFLWRDFDWKEDEAPNLSLQVPRVQFLSDRTENMVTAYFVFDDALFHLTLVLSFSFKVYNSPQISPLKNLETERREWRMSFVYGSYYFLSCFLTQLFLKKIVDYSRNFNISDYKTSADMSHNLSEYQTVVYFYACPCNKHMWALAVVTYSHQWYMQ